MRGRLAVLAALIAAVARALGTGAAKAPDIGALIAAGRRRAVEVFGQDAVVARYRAIYERVIGPSR